LETHAVQSCTNGWYQQNQPQETIEEERQLQLQNHQEEGGDLVTSNQQVHKEQCIVEHYYSIYNLQG